MIVTRIIGKENEKDIRLLNEPFSLFGRLLPSYQNGVWEYTQELFPPDRISEMCFPDENYDFDQMCSDHIFIGAYDGDCCVGLAIVQKPWLKYLYLYDFKVNRSHRSTGAAAQLLEHCCRVARELGCRGIYTQGQDNNLAACRFYLKHGFVIGGLDTMVYNGTSQQGKSDVIFYLDL